MKQVKRIVDTSFWSDDKVLNFSPEDKYFMLFLLTNEYTSQLGIYHLPIKKASLDLGYNQDSVMVLLDRFEHQYEIIKYSAVTSEVAIKNYLLYSIVSGGKPVLDCLLKETDAVKEKSLLEYIYINLINKNIKNETVKRYLDLLKTLIINNNDNERYVHESSTNRTTIRTPKQIERFNPPTLEEIRAYCLERHNSVDPKQFYDYYAAGDWKDQSGKPVKNWKQKMIAVWEKDNNGRNSNTQNETEHEPKYRLSDL